MIMCYTDIKGIVFIRINYNEMENNSVHMAKTHKLTLLDSSQNSPTEGFNYLVRLLASDAKPLVF